MWCSRQEGPQLSLQDVQLLCSPSIKVATNQNLDTSALVLQHIILQALIPADGSRCELVTVDDIFLLWQ